MQQQQSQPLSQREQRKLDQVVRLISKNDPQLDRNASHQHRPRKIRKTAPHVQINAGSQHFPNAKNEEQEQALETKSGSYLTPQHQRANNDDRNKPMDQTSESIKDPLNTNYPLEGQTVSEYLVVYEIAQQEKLSGEKKQLQQTSSGQDLVVKVDAGSLKIVEKLSKTMKQFSQVIGGVPLNRRWKQFNKKWRSK